MKTVNTSLRYHILYFRCALGGQRRSVETFTLSRGAFIYGKNPRILVRTIRSPRNSFGSTHCTALFEANALKNLY